MSSGSYKLAVNIAIVFLLLALLPFWPYGFFTLLRLVIFAVSAYLAFASFINKHFQWLWFFAIIALLFNPFIIVGLPRGLWVVIDLVVAIVLLFFRINVIPKYSEGTGS